MLLNKIVEEILNKVVGRVNVKDTKFIVLINNLLFHNLSEEIMSYAMDKEFNFPESVTINIHDISIEVINSNKLGYQILMDINDIL